MGPDGLSSLVAPRHPSCADAKDNKPVPEPAGANLEASWIGVDAAALFERSLHQPVVVLNDADAAGIAEMAFGAGRGRAGVVMMLTLGTGIGTALFVNGRLVPNTEFGHIIVAGEDGEKLAAASVRTTQSLAWDD